jgi:cardiolipin synthase A/B
VRETARTCRDHRPLQRRPAPILVLPPLQSSVRLQRAIDVPDLVEDAGVFRARLLYASGLGRHAPIPDQEIAFVAGGQVAAVAATHRGDAEISADPAVDAVGVYRMAERKDLDPVSAIEERVHLIRPGSRPLILFDAALGARDLSLVAKLDGPEAPELLAVRMRPTQSCRAIRARLRRAGIRPCVIDASAVLDEGAALDVGKEMDVVRLARVAARMRGAAGFPVVAIVHGAEHAPSTAGFAALTAEQLGSAAQWPVERRALPRSLEVRLVETTGAELIAGNRVEIELDNATARHWLLDAIRAACRRVHLQVYMAADDDVGSQVESALAEAGARGLTVRVLVDSLHGLDGSFGARNPLLERLRTRPGVELRLVRPVTGLPSLEDLKRRDHRKIAIVDGTLALLGGRNLAHEYYTGFEEVKLTAQTPWREVPWLDAGARVEGPAVAVLERSFLDAWTETGGSAFDIERQPAAGTTPVRVVVHQGLRDACTLEAYLALIDSARSHVNTVNGFPMLLEIQHALLRALRRGVRVRCLVGHLTPTHDGTPFDGSLVAARNAATDFVHSRIDAIVAAGGEGYLYAVPQQPGWALGLGVICPHVHAKVISVDGQVCTVGSANLDITAGYWESELMLIVEDGSVARKLEEWIDRLIEGSKAFDRNDPLWQQAAARRGWMRHWPGVLSF